MNAVKTEIKTYQVDPVHSTVGFMIRHLVGRVEGRFNRFSGTISMDSNALETLKVEFAIEADSVNTDNEHRDTHLRGADFFDVENFPTMTFVSHRSEPLGPREFQVQGTLTLHGISQEMSIPVTLLGVGEGTQGEVAGFASEFTINRKDFGIVWNSLLDRGGTMLGDEVRVRLSVEAAAQ